MVKLNLTLPASFFENEVREGYLVTHDTKKLWAVLLDLLGEFIRVCSKHNIKWWAEGGTLLGTIRHKGFIPWDDDIDIIMMREEFDRLCVIASKEFKHPYFFQTEETDPDSLRGHAQLRNSLTTGILKIEENAHYTFNQGIFIDIFVLDTVPDDKRLFEKQTQAFQFKRLAWRSRNRHVRRKKKIFSLINLLSKYKQKKYYNRFQREISKYAGMDSEYVAILYSQYAPRYLKKRCWFDDTIYLPFEMFNLPVPIGYKEYLDNLYGDWHTCKKEPSMHGGLIIDTDRPYTEYI